MEFGRSNRLDHGTDPLAAFLRKYAMKVPFLERLEAHLHADEGAQAGVYPNHPGSKLVVYGSTLMGKFVQDGAKMPFVGLKVSDIDMGVILPNARFGEEKDFYEHVSPKIHAAVCGTGLKFAQIKPAADQLGRSNFSESDFNILDPARVSPTALTGDFYVCRDFTPDEMRKLIAMHRDSPEARTIEQYVGNEPKRVYMAISAHGKEFPALMEPISYFGKTNGCNQVYRHDRYDMIAGKLARLMSAQPKAADVIDLYNLYKGESPDGKPLLRIGGERSAIPTLRLLTLMFICLNRQSVQSFTHDKNFADVIRPEGRNVEWFRREIAPQLALHRRNEVIDAAPEILRDTSQFVDTIFPRIEQKGPDTLWSRLHADERQFVCKFFGREYRPGGKPVAKGGWASILGRSAAAAVENEELPLRQAGSGQQFQLDLSLLEERYAPAFQHYPKLRGNIAQSAMVAAKLSEMNFGKGENSMMVDG
jgi:hypothetical protein